MQDFVHQKQTPSPNASTIKSSNRSIQSRVVLYLQHWRNHKFCLSPSLSLPIYLYLVCCVFFLLFRLSTKNTKGFPSYRMCLSIFTANCPANIGLSSLHHHGFLRFTEKNNPQGTTPNILQSFVQKNASRRAMNAGQFILNSYAPPPKKKKKTNMASWKITTFNRK